VGDGSRDLFNASVSITIGSGASVLFWEDPWIDGRTADTIALALMKHIRSVARRACTVAKGLLNHSWARDIRGELYVEAIRGYLNLWGVIHVVPRADAVEDSFRWKWTADGSYSSKSAYLTLFHGTMALPGAANVWHSSAPLQVQVARMAVATSAVLDG
jgi:hypothetical protein